MPGLPAYEDEHRFFVQGIMCRGVLNSKEVNLLHEKALKKCGIELPEKRKDQQDLLLANIKTINEELESVGLTIRKGVDEDTGESYFMLINTQNRMVGQSRDLACKVQTQWTEAELDFLRLLATEILQSDEKSISSSLALNLMDHVGGRKKLSMTEAEKAINKLIQAKWLKTVDGNIALDIRFLGEMENWMVEVMGGVAKCQICRKVVVRGVYCTCEDSIAWHKYCLAKQSKAGVATRCKKCKDVIHPAATGDRTEAIKRPLEDTDQDEKSPESNDRESVMEVVAGPSETRRRVVLESDSE